MVISCNVVGGSDGSGNNVIFSGDDSRGDGGTGCDGSDGDGGDDHVGGSGAVHVRAQR